MVLGDTDESSVVGYLPLDLEIALDVDDRCREYSHTTFGQLWGKRQMQFEPGTPTN